MTNITAVKGPAAQVEADVLVVPVVEGDRSPLKAAPQDVSSEPYKTVMWPGEGVRASRVLYIGAGKRAELDADRARTIGGAAARATAQHFATVAIAPRLESHVEPMVEGFLIGAYEPDLYKSERARSVIEQLLVVGDARKGIDTAKALAEGTNLARTLVSEPPNELTPSRLAEHAEALEGVNVRTLRGDELDGFGGLLGVAKGSDEPPVFITMEWAPRGAKRSPVLGLVGKGITFDSGGLSLKPNDGMQWMKGDMAGAAAVIGAMQAIARLKLPIRVKAAIPSTENMPSGKATRVGDVLRAYNGKTMEILNTDAEGRLVLADALSWLAGQGVTHIVDAATLTGAIEVALGKVAFGVFGRPDRFVDRVVAASRKAGERAWPMPLYPEYKEQIRSEIADVKNVGGRPAGSITAALFLAEFVPDGLPWAHLDIAGVAWDDKKPYRAAGATGAGVRALVRIAQDLAEKG